MIWIKKAKLYFQRRKASLQMPDALFLLSGALRSGQTMDQALKFMIDEMPDPLGEIFRMRMTSSVEWLSFAEKANRLFVDERYSPVRAALLLAKEGGSNAADVVSQVARHLQKIIETEKKIKVLTAQGKLSAWVVGISPFGFLLGMSFFSPDIMRSFFSSQFGWNLLGLMILLDVVGLAVVTKMAQVEI